MAEKIWKLFEKVKGSFKRRYFYNPEGFAELFLKANESLSEKKREDFNYWIGYFEEDFSLKWLERIEMEKGIDLKYLFASICSKALAMGIDYLIISFALPQERPEPTEKDLRNIFKLEEILRNNEIILLDCLILGQKDSFFSFRREGYLREI